jgi:Tol biopolymer transport system component
VLESFSNFAFSPDGEFLYFNARKEASEEPSIYRVPSLGGTPTKVLSNAFDVQFSPDGKQLSFGRLAIERTETAIFVANTDGTNERKIAARSGTQFYDGAAVWSPDGQKLAVPTGDDSAKPKPMWITLMSVADGSTFELGTTRWVTVDDLVWHPSGDSIIISAVADGLTPQQLYEVAHPSGEVRRLTNNLNGHTSVSITSDGKSIVTGEIFARSAVWVSPDQKPENAKQVMPASGDTWGLSWTPDNRIVYVSDQTGDAEIWVMDPDGANAKPLTHDRIFKTVPVVSSDGRYIVYTSGGDGENLVRINIDGSNRVVVGALSGADNPDISSDGKWVIFSAWLDGASRIYRIPIDGGEPQRLTENIATEPRYSRDGARFACFISSDKSLRWNRLAIFPADGGEPIKIFDIPSNTNVGRGPIWTPDDSGITLVVAPGELQNLWLQPVNGAEGRMMTNFQLPGVARREYSRDGKRIAIVRAEGIGNAIMITDFR